MAAADGSVRLALKAVLDAYFIERDLDAALSVTCDDVRALSPSACEPVEGKEPLSHLLASEFSERFHPFSYDIASYDEWMLADGLAQCSAFMFVMPVDSNDSFPPLPLCVTVTFRRDDGMWKVLLLHASSPRRTGIDDGAALAFHEHIGGIEQLRREAATDALTGMINRRETTRLIDAVPENTEGMFLLADVDDFKSINDRFGHQAGDEALIALAQSLKDNVRREDVVGRLGGDEFVVYLSRLEDRGVVKGKVAAFGRDFAEALAGIAPGLSATLSVGVAQRGPGESFDDLYRRADAALYKAKHSGKDTMFFDDEMGDWGRVHFEMREGRGGEEPDRSA